MSRLPEVEITFVCRRKRKVILRGLAQKQNTTMKESKIIPELSLTKLQKIPGKMKQRLSLGVGIWRNG